MNALDNGTGVPGYSTRGLRRSTYNNEVYNVCSVLHGRDCEITFVRVSVRLLRLQFLFDSDEILRSDSGPEK